MSLDRHSLTVLTTFGFADYALVDSGEGRKLERFGSIFVDRPEPQALWQRQRPGHWTRAHAVFSASGEDEEKGRWRTNKSVPASWPVHIGGATILCRLKGLWHLGLFPEQKPHWDWMVGRITDIKRETPRVLNLFAYTGAASLLAAAAGAEVTHVDASKTAISWAKENRTASNLRDARIRWILDDASKFTAREVRRGKTYHVILVDPPKFGRGPDGEVWELFARLPALLRDCAALLSPTHSAIILTVYAIRASTLAFGQLVQEVLATRGGEFEIGELVIAEEEGRRFIPTSLFTRWQSDDGS